MDTTFTGKAEKGGPLNVQTMTAASLESGTSPSPSVSTHTLPKSEPQQTLTTWDGPDDPGNPRNWSVGARVYGVAVPTWYSFVVTFGTSVYAAGIFDIMDRFHVSRTVSILGLSLYAVGLALGPIVGAPMSETFGRKGFYIASMPLFMLFTMGAGLARNIETILTCRFFASLFGAPALAVGAGSLADLWDLQKNGAIIGIFYIMMPFIGSSLGPVVGGYLVQNRHDYAWTMWILIMVGGPAWIASFFLRETMQKQILKKRALERGMLPPPKLPPKQALKLLMTVTLVRPIHMLLTEPIIGWMSLYVAFGFGILFAFFDAFPYAFGLVYHFSMGEIGLTYLGVIVGIVFAAITFGVVDKTIYARAKARVTEEGKIPPPEERLYVCMGGSLLLPISLFWFAWTARASVHWVVPVLAGVPFGWGVVSLVLGTSCYLVEAYQALNAASAIAANSLLRYLFGAAFPLFTVQMFDRLGIDWACSLLGFISVAMLPIPWILYKWGPLLRRRSSYEMANF